MGFVHCNLLILAAVNIMRRDQKKKSPHPPKSNLVSPCKEKLFVWGFVRGFFFFFFGGRKSFGPPTDFFSVTRFDLGGGGEFFLLRRIILAVECIIRD